MLNGKELLDNNTHIIYEKITTDELPLKVIEVTLAKDDPNLIPPKHWHRSLEFIIPLTASIELWSNGETYSIARNGLAIISNAYFLAFSKSFVSGCDRAASKLSILT